MLFAHCPYDHRLDAGQLLLSWQFALFLTEEVSQVNQHQKYPDVSV